MKELSRRDFLKGALAGTAAAALTTVTGVSAFAEEKGIYTPGTYSASAKGIGSDVTITMTFDANSITDVAIDVSGETPGIGAAIGEQMQDAILAAQGADVDAVTVRRPRPALSRRADRRSPSPSAKRPSATGWARLRKSPRATSPKSLRPRSWWSAAEPAAGLPA